MNYNSTTQSFDASNTDLATQPNVTNQPASPTGVTSPYTGFTSSQSPATVTTAPAVVSNYNTQNKVNDITSTFQDHANTATPSFPTGVSHAVYAPATNEVGQFGSTGKFLGYASNAQEEQNLLGGVNSQGQSLSSGSFAPPQDAQLQSNGTYLYQGNYYTKDQLSSPESIAAINNTATQQKKYDAALQSQLDSINKQYDMYRQQQEQVTSSGAAGAQNALLQSGAGGRGSVAQYAAVTADGRVQSIMQDGQRALAKLDAQRSDLLSQAQMAYQDKNYQLLQNLNTQITKNRDEMVASAKKATEALATATDQAKKDTSISSLYEKGITDPAQILSKLQEQGIKNVTLKDISDSIKNITPPELKGVDELLTTMRNNGAPAEAISKVLSAKTMSEAYTAAGNYSAGGTGIIGEYNYYKNQAKQAGQTPVDFNTYQNMDANRKAKVAAAGVATGLGVNGNLKPLTEAQAKDLTYAQRGANAMDVINNLQNDIVKMGAINYSTQKGLENTSIGNTMVSDTVQQVRQAERDFLTAILRRESGASISPSEFAVAERQYFPQPGDNAKTLEQKKKTRETAIASFRQNVPNFDQRVSAETTGSMLLKQGATNPLHLDTNTGSAANNPLGI